MAPPTTAPSPALSAAALVERLGPIALSRIRFEPEPGHASEQDVVEIHERERRLFELVDGVLVEKTVGVYESYLAVVLSHLLATHVQQHDLGLVLGADGMVRLSPGLVRIPDMSIIRWEQLPNRRLPRTPILDLAPALAVEVLGAGNTEEEMNRKRQDYFAAGVGEVWYIDAAARALRVYCAPNGGHTFTADEVFESSVVLAGFRLDLQSFFAEPGDAR